MLLGFALIALGITEGDFVVEGRNFEGKGSGVGTTNLSFEAKLWAAADALRNNMATAEYPHAAFRLGSLRT